MAKHQFQDPLDLMEIRGSENQEESTDLEGGSLWELWLFAILFVMIFSAIAHAGL